jgi:hypothetical protein
MDVCKINFSESDKLVDASNYLLWAYHVETIFKLLNLWETVSPPSVSVNLNPDLDLDEPPPAGVVVQEQPPPPEDDADVNVVEPAQVVIAPERPAALTASAVKKAKEKSMAILIYTVHRSILPLIKSIGENPAKVWSRLKTCFQSRAEQQKMDLMHDLQDIKMVAGTTVEQFLLLIDSIVQQLAAMDELVTDRQLVHIVLKGLPSNSPHWVSFKATFGTIMLNDKTLTLADLETQLQALRQIYKMLKLPSRRKQILPLLLSLSSNRP